MYEHGADFVDSETDRNTYWLLYILLFYILNFFFSHFFFFSAGFEFFGNPPFLLLI